ncbi:radical SAM protein [Nonomuraea sp. NPDC055795]
MSATITTLDLELTGRCPLACLHCYAGSGPTGGHGVMTADDWLDVIAQGADFGITHVQLIGGEPTAHPSFQRILRTALDYGLSVEVFTNLVHVRAEWWSLFSCQGVTLGTSYYSDQADDHDQVTGRAGSHARTRANIEQALHRSIPIRASVIKTRDDQRVEQAREELLKLGVSFVRIDWARGVGRGSALRGSAPDLTQLCGRCGKSKAAITPDGDLFPCVMTRWMPAAGNVRTTPLGDIIGGETWRELVTVIPPRQVHGCPPDDGNDCGPANNEVCGPAYDDD